MRKDWVVLQQGPEGGGLYIKQWFPNELEAITYALDLKAKDRQDSWAHRYFVAQLKSV